MKHFKLITTIFLSAIILAACSGNSDVNAVKDSAIENTSTLGGTVSGGDASFSCKIDGKDFSGTGNDQLANAAFMEQGGSLKFVLMPIVSGQKGIPQQMNFSVADKGTTIVHGSDNPDYSVVYSEANAVDNNYTCKEMTVRITSSGASRVTGTFSGTLIEPKTDREVPVTDGKFDIPYSSYSKK